MFNTDKVQLQNELVQESTSLSNIQPRKHLHQMGQIPNIGGLLNNLAQQKLMIAASHVFQSNTSWGVHVFNEMGEGVEIPELSVY